MKKIAAIATVAALVGCAPMKSAGDPVPIGPDTYRIMAISSFPEPMQQAYRNAGASCASMGKELMVLETVRGKRDWDTFELTYRCLAKGDPDLRRMVPSRQADVSVEVR